MDSDRRRLVVTIGAASLFFATIEYLVPKPVPFFRIGLANLPLLMALPVLRGSELVRLFFIKTVGQALLGGTLSSYVFLFSGAGTLASLLAMYWLWRWLGRRVGWIGLAAVGALASNAVQIWFSVWFIFGQTAWIIAPIFLILGFVAGLLVGIGALVLAQRSAWYAAVRQRFGTLGPLPAGSAAPESISQVLPEIGPAKKKHRWRLQLSPAWDFMAKILSPRQQLGLGLLCLPAFLLQENLLVKAGLALFWMLMALFAGKRLQPLYFLSMSLSIVIFNLLSPSGLVIAQVLGVAVTQGAVLSGLSKVAGIIGLVFLSLATVRKQVVLPGRIGATIAQVFQAYERLLAERSTIKWNRLVASIDTILINLVPESPKSPLSDRSQPPAAGRRRFLGQVVLSTIVGLHYFLLVWPGRI